MTREQILRKLNQAYELAGLARMDRDPKDEARWMKEATRLRTMLVEEDYEDE